MKTAANFVYILLLLFSYNTLAAEKVLFISDVDDTIKVSHVRSMAESIAYSQLTTNVFSIMPELYSSLIQENSNSEIYYVSKAPAFLLETKYLSFLTENQFPKAQNLLSRPNPFDSKFKHNTIIKLINEVRPTTVVLIGDDGEMDPKTYQEIREILEPLGYKVHVYIRQLYTKFNINEDDPKPLTPMAPKTNSFISPLDLALNLNEAGLLSDASLNEIALQVQNKLESGLEIFPFEPQMIPIWADCSDYQWSKSLSKLNSNLHTLPSVLLSRCQ